MSKFKRVLLHGVLFSCLAVLPVSAFAMGVTNGENGMMKAPKTEQQQSPQVTKTGVNFGVYYGRPNYYRPYYNHYYPYRYHYRYYHPYRWYW